MMQVLLPMLLGVKSASTIIVVIAAVAFLTFKAFIASNIALLVTGVMAAKKLMESMTGSMASHQQPYMYPMEYSAPGTHPSYSMPANVYANPDMFGVTGLGGHGHELLQPQQPINVEQVQDIAGQYSQNIAEIQNANVTNGFHQTPASKRWDGFMKKQMFYDDSSFKEYDRAN